MGSQGKEIPQPEQMKDFVKNPMDGAPHRMGLYIQATIFDFTQNRKSQRSKSSWLTTRSPWYRRLLCSPLKMCVHWKTSFEKPPDDPARLPLYKFQTDAQQSRNNKKEAAWLCFVGENGFFRRTQTSTFYDTVFKKIIPFTAY